KPGGGCAHLCAWITRIVIAIGDAVKGHRGRTRAQHCHADPDDLPCGRNSARCQHRAEKCERQRKQRVLDLDHFERGANLMGDRRHKTQNSKLKTLIRPSILWPSNAGAQTDRESESKDGRPAFLSSEADDRSGDSRRRSERPRVKASTYSLSGWRCKASRAAL